MIPIFNIRGYTAVDPLDRASTRMRFILLWGVSAALGVPFLYIQAYILKIVGYTTVWTFIVGALIYTFLMGSLLVILRKSSSLLFWFMILASASSVDIFREAYLNAHGVSLFWFYYPDNFISNIATPWRFFVAWTFDGILQGAMVLYVARLLASLIYPASKGKNIPTREQQRALFPNKWSDEPVKKPARGAAFWALRIIGAIYLAYLAFCLIGLIGVSPWPERVQGLFKMTFDNPALGINTFAKLSLMGLLGFIGAYNVSVRWHTTFVMLIGHAVSTVASVWLYFYTGPADANSFITSVIKAATKPASPPYRDFLALSAVVDTVMSLIFVLILITHRQNAKKFAAEKDFPDFFSLPDMLNRAMFYAIGVITLLTVPVALAFRIKASGTHGLGAVFGYPDAQLSNTITMFTTMAVLALLMARRIKLRSYVFGVLLFGLVVTFSGEALWGVFGSFLGIGIATRAGGVARVDWYFALAALSDAITIAAMLGFRKMYYEVDYLINALNPSSAQNAQAIHNALFDGTPEENAIVLKRIDLHVAGVRGRKRGLLNFPFWLIEQVFSVVFGLHPKFSTMSRDEQRYFLRYYVLRTPREISRSFIPLLADLAYKIGTAAHALATFAHYTTAKGWTETGYVPPDARDRLQADHATAAPPYQAVAPLPDSVASPYNFKPPQPPHAKSLVAPRVSQAVNPPSIPDDVDYLIVGSGAGGACMAYRLATAVKDPSRILVVERGPRYSPLQDFNDDEMEMTRKLYKEGGLQASKRFDLIIMQGECVGGTTVINNAICFEMPQNIRQIWQNDYGVDLSRLDAEYRQVERELEISHIPDEAVNRLVKQRFVDGVKGYNAGVSPQDQLILEEKPLKANQRSMLGDGLDNIGNMRLRKRSMLETYIPWSEARGVQVVSDTSAVRFITDRAGKRAESVLLRDNVGNLKRVRVHKAVILAGGVIASSNFLMRSEVERNVGRGLSCNFAFPVAFEFPEKVDAFDGTQITMGALDQQSRAIFETYSNPPGTFAISLPFYFERLTRLMKSFRRVTDFGVLVGSEPNGVISKRPDVISGRPFTWTLGDEDVAKIKYALTTVLDIARAGGAVRGMLPMTPGIDIPLTADDLESFKKHLKDYPLRLADLKLLTAHPQGGNRMMGDNSKYRAARTVDANFRVDGFENVFVADASLFPTGITVNPQWTIMAMSSIAASHVLERADGKAAAATA